MLQIALNYIDNAREGLKLKKYELEDLEQNAFLWTWLQGVNSKEALQSRILDCKIGN